MPTAGDTITVPTSPGARVATTEVTGDSSFQATELTVISVTAPLVSGRTYRVKFASRIGGTVAADIAAIRIREDSVTGTIMQSGRILISDNDAVGWGPLVLERQYTATATANKTFVGTGQRTTGSGSPRLDAGTVNPAYLYVDYISG
jgi:hypothetical protein